MTRADGKGFINKARLKFSRCNYDVRGSERKRSLLEDSLKGYDNPRFKRNQTLTKKDEGTLDDEKIHSISKTL